MDNFLIFIYLFLSIINKINGETYECPVNYCKNYIENDECPKLEKTDDDHKLQLLSPTPCNCCDYYLIKLDEGDQCLIGTPSSPRPYSICGDGLYCKGTLQEGEGKCAKIITECTKKQAEWDNKRADGTLGILELRPKCDRNGDFEPVWCIPEQTCYCLNKQGERIFGTMEFESSVERDTYCDCSRKVDIASKLISNTFKFENPIIRCLPNGNYDPLQCINNDGCLCTDEKTGVPSDNDWLKKLVDVSYINNETLWCFNEEIHTENEFLKPCQIEYDQIRNETLTLKENGIIRLRENLLKCQPDGSYDQVQENSATKYCADPLGAKLKEYAVDISSELAKTMNCNCARSEYILEHLGKDYLRKPECCENGNYYQIQCRFDQCYCVDKNGNQIEKEVHKSKINKLSCYSKTTKKCTE